MASRARVRKPRIVERGLEPLGAGEAVGVEVVIGGVVVGSMSVV